MKSQQQKYQEAVERNVRKLHTAAISRAQTGVETVTEFLAKLKHHLGIKQADQQFDTVLAAKFSQPTKKGSK